MKTINIDIPKIHCIRQQHDRISDEVYGLLLITTVSGQQINRPFARILPIRRDVRSKQIWRGLQQAENIELPDTASGLVVCLALYEKDDGAIYDKIVNEATGAPLSNSVPWQQILQELNVDLELVNGRWKEAASRATVRVLKHYRLEDALGVECFAIDLSSEEPDHFSREFTMKSRGGKYKVQIVLS